MEWNAEGLGSCILQKISKIIWWQVKVQWKEMQIKVRERALKNDMTYLSGSGTQHKVMQEVRKFTVLVKKYSKRICISLGYVVVLVTTEERLSFMQFILNLTKPINDYSSDPGLCLCPAAMTDSKENAWSLPLVHVAALRKSCESVPGSRVTSAHGWVPRAQGCSEATGSAQGQWFQSINVRGRWAWSREWPQSSL